MIVVAVVADSVIVLNIMFGHDLHLKDYYLLIFFFLFFSIFDFNYNI